MNPAFIVLLSPLATALTKIVVGLTGRTISPYVIPIISMVWGAIADVLSKPELIVTGEPGAVIGSAIEGAVAGLAGSKGRDYIKNKPNAISTADKQVIEVSKPIA